MTEVLAIATILGGIAAVWYFIEKVTARRNIRASHTQIDDGLARRVEDLESRPGVFLPKGSRVIGEPWPHDPTETRQIKEARDLVSHASTVMRSLPAPAAERLAEGIARFEQRIQLYDYGELAPISFDKERRVLVELLDSAEHPEREPSGA